MNKLHASGSINVQNTSRPDPLCFGISDWTKTMSHWDQIAVSLKAKSLIQAKCQCRYRFNDSKAQKKKHTTKQGLQNVQAAGLLWMLALSCNGESASISLHEEKHEWSKGLLLTFFKSSQHSAAQDTFSNRLSSGHTLWESRAAALVVVLQTKMIQELLLC